MIEIIDVLSQDYQMDASKELMLLSFISQGFFQPFTLEENLIAVLSALTSGVGLGFNRAMLFLVEGGKLQGRLWLGPRSSEEAHYIWNALSRPGIGYAEIIEHNRALLNPQGDNLSRRIQSLSYDLKAGEERVPSLATIRRDIVLVKGASGEPRLDRRFQEIIGVEDFLCIPLLARDETLGEVILDNAITGAPIVPRDIKLASLCGLMAGNTMAMARLHRRMTEMERMAAMGEMAGFVTHELRNPLAAVGGFLEQMADPDASERKKKRNLRIIRTEVRRLEDILFKLAHLMKVELEQAPPCAIGPILESVLADPGLRRKKQHRMIAVSIADNLPPARCDAVYAREAIRNILDNALDATPDEGRIEVRADRGSSAGELVIIVKDQGPGIPDSIRGNIFTPFFSTKSSGLGLGLVFVKRVMEASGGRVEFDSEQGPGVTVRLYFPADRKESS
jgi:signal transduction histidine kinase